MKKLVLALILAVAFFTISCSEDDFIPENEENFSALIVGEWKLEMYYQECENGSLFENSPFPNINHHRCKYDLIFMADGTWSVYL